MNLATHLIRKGASRIIAERHLKGMRGEHDAWAANAQLDTTYYTIKPSGMWVQNIGPAYHLPLVFTEHGRGMYKGQLLTERGASSWRLWQELGPLTARKMVTPADCERADQLAAAGEMHRAQQAVATATGWQAEWASAAREYPASVAALQAA